MAKPKTRKIDNLLNKKVNTNLDQSNVCKLQSAEQMAITLMNNHGLLQAGWKFKWDKAISSAGCCHFSSSTITLSRHLIPLMPESEVRDIILHEIAHALVGVNHAHDVVWKAKAIEIGCSGNRCYDSNYSVKPKYKAICINGHISYGHRRLHASCGVCSSHFNEKYLLKYQSND